MHSPFHTCLNQMILLIISLTQNIYTKRKLIRCYHLASNLVELKLFKVFLN